MTDSQIIICLVGNKIDQESKREVTFDQGKKYAEEKGYLFFESSALNGANIEDIFLQICNKFPKSNQQLNKDPSMILLKQSEPHKSYCC